MDQEHKRPVDYEVSLNSNAGPGSTVGPLQSDLTALYNERHEACERKDAKRIAELDSDIAETLDLFVRTEATSAPIPDRIIATMKAGWHHSKGEPEGTLQENWNAWQATYLHKAPKVKPDRMKLFRASTANNLFEALDELGHAREALAWAYLAAALEPIPEREIALVRAEYAIGNHEEAERLLAGLLKQAKFDDRYDMLAARMSRDRKLQSKRDLPSNKKLLECVELRTRTLSGKA